ncbi:uncharacterized protein LOC121419505 [Lytechinus variegatus]|uniref:uncharacterized protein LOC121419505 n=1 Tax=Lytechinus variegatus TaxID=7654 RepID=UPI001BB1236B|nr:uncharacterized protein LOC121419505 [Lytechinus variegatus]XP_041469892.1 uncharacterized protein LOC121419505 [Lytechinus variegatus]
MNSATKPDFDGTLKLIARALYKNEEIDDLGSALGFTPADIGRYTNANEKQGGNYMGTLDMLRTWQKRQTVSTEKGNLRSALLAANLVSLADKYLGTPENGPTPQASIQPSTQGVTSINTNSVGMKVTNNDIIKLSKLMPCDYFNDFGVALGFSLTDAKNTLTRHQLNARAAYEEILNAWSLKTGGLRRDLDKALLDVECFALIDQYKN